MLPNLIIIIKKTQTDIFSTYIHTSICAYIKISVLFPIILSHTVISRWDHWKDIWPLMLPCSGAAVAKRECGCSEALSTSLQSLQSLPPASPGLRHGEWTVGLMPRCKHCVPVIGFLLQQGFTHQQKKKKKIQWKWLPLSGPMGSYDFFFFISSPPIRRRFGVPSGRRWIWCGAMIKSFPPQGDPHAGRRWKSKKDAETREESREGRRTSFF